jgi:hypothetical protein
VIVATKSIEEHNSTTFTAIDLLCNTINDSDAISRSDHNGTKKSATEEVVSPDSKMMMICFVNNWFATVLFAAFFVLRFEKFVARFCNETIEESYQKSKKNHK